MFDATAPHGLGSYGKSEYLSGLSDEAIEVLIERHGHGRSGNAWSPSQSGAST